MTMKKGRVPQKEKFEPREVKRVDGWEDSEGKVHDHPVKAAAVQAELDLFRLVFHYIDVEEAMDGSIEDAKKAVRNMFREHRDLFMRLLPAAYMTPDELGEAMDRHAGAGRSKAPLAPSYESKAKEILKHAFDKGWERRGDFEGNTHAPDRTLAFDKYWMMRTSEELRYLLPPVRDAHTSIHADDDDAASGLRRPQVGKTLEEQFNALPDLSELPRPVRQRIETKAEELFETYRKQHPVKNYDEFEPWSKQSTTERSRFINEARRALMI